MRRIHRQVIKLELEALGFESDFRAVSVDVSDEEIWEATAFRYFDSNYYYLPVCRREANTQVA